MKFKEGVIITCKFFYGEEITCDVRNMKDIFEMNWCDDEGIIE
jgi:hypothetical protein